MYGQYYNFLLLIINSLKFYDHSNIKENSIIQYCKFICHQYIIIIVFAITKILSQKIILKNKIILALYSLFHSLSYNYSNTVQLFNS